MTARIDHFMYAVPSLDEGMDWAAELFGVAPAYGGEHVGLGTRNALMSLGDTYLEIIAPDPAQPDGDHMGRKFAALSAGGLVTWAVQGSLARIARDLNEAGVATSGPHRTERNTADGETLVWELLFPVGSAFGSRMPFFIDWLDCAHPSDTNPVAGQLGGLSISDPGAAELQAVLDALGLDVAVAQGSAALTIEIDTSRGPVILESTVETSAIAMR